MRLTPLLAASLLFIAAVHAPGEEARHRKGGFTGVTPKPTTPKRPVEATPRPKKSTPVENPGKPKRPSAEESAPAPKKSKPGVDATSEAKSEETKDAAKASETIPPLPKKEYAPAATLEPEQLAEFSALPARVRSLIRAALELTKLNLTYTYGSADPAQGGMDCSGTMHHLLTSQGCNEVPRDSSGQYVWVRKAGPFFAVVSKSAESFEFKDLQPGDLLFWTGTYETGREIPISHVMLYLGTEKKRKQRVMFGASDGRTYDGIQRWGVSVFDFKMPNGAGSSGEPAKVDFVGYGRIPELHTAQELTTRDETPAPATSAAAKANPKPAGKSFSKNTTKKKRSK